VCAAVVGDADADADAVMGFARTMLAAYKCPKQVFFVDALPRTSTGKVRRLDLAEAADQGA
jgi:acyl-coenzyme A synthetase/AMP-(fatty) acid ligase